MNKKNRAVSLLLVIAMVLLLIPSFGITASAAHTINGGVVVIDPAFVAQYGTEFIIQGDVFSVTVIGEIEVSIIFNNVQIDRSKDSAGTNIAGIYTAGERLYNNGWTTRPNTSSSYYVPTCPFLITGGAKVTARFDGTCTFKAGYNGWYATNNNNLALTNNNHCGYAGIQVDSGASLTISSAQKLSAYGAYQMASADTDYVNAVKNKQTVKDSSGNVITVGDGEFDIKDIIAYNSKPFKSNTYDTGSNGYGQPDGSNASNHSGGAGIGGGATYNITTSSGKTYTAGTPGTIIINTGNITAVGGHTAAGIGGGLNGAATSSKIEINGGEITAVAGRWAAAIGDGDSVGDSNGNVYTSTKFDVSNNNSYEIIINGGVINAYGGLSASAIGTTDEVTNKGNKKTSALSITITGGTINAQSGESYDGQESYTAAIGAGNGTDMQDNHITIYSAAEIVASSFSQYAISNYGTKKDVPSVNIDPEGYVYLVRFNDTADVRTFKIYAIHKNANGHFMYVPTTASDIADGVINNPTTQYYYAYDPGHVASNGKDIGGFYLVDSDGANVVPADYATNPNNYIFDEDSNRYYPNTIPNLSAYYDKNEVIETITVPGKYKAVAVTLPHPDQYGGSYVLEVPLTNDAGEKMYALLQKDLPGVTSGMLSSGTDVSANHVGTGDNPPPATNIKPNIVIDGTAKPFTNLSVGVYKDGVEQPSLITNFVETVYGYTIYVPNETKQFWLDFAFATKYVNDEGKEVTAALSLLTVNGVNKLPNNVNGSVNLTNLEFGTSDRVDIWIKKTDTVSGSTKTISYKITLIIKDKYSFLLNLDALDKTYDGIPVDPTFKALIDGEAGFETDHQVGAVKTENKGETTTNLPINSGTVTFSSSGYNGYEYTINYTISDISFSADGTATYTVSFTCNNYTAIYVFAVDKGKNVTFETNDTYLTLFESNNNNYYSTSYRAKITGTTNNNSINLQLQSYSSWNQSWSNVNNKSASISITQIVSTNTAPSDLAVPDSFISEKEAELKQKLETSGEYSVSQTYVYTDGVVYTSTYSAKLGDCDAATYSSTYTLSRDVKVIVSAAGGKNYTDMMTQEEIDAIVYTFYQDTDGDDVYETSLGTQAPKNAGRYQVVATLDAAKYEAEGSVEFEISKKEIHIVAIDNWLKYVSNTDISTFDGKIADPGNVYFDGVISGETVNLLPSAKFNYVNLGDTTTYIDDITYNDRKIRIENPELDAASSVNYILVGVVDNVCYVPGQIAYSTVGAIFRKAADNIPNTSLWRKYYPVDETNNLSWLMNDDGITFNDARIDYHSPVPNGASEDNGYGGGTVGIHREYVKLRTKGDTSARYSIDIEFGAMQFQYTKTIWNVNTGEYEALEGESKWNGNNGTNNAVTITNRSNAEIYYKIEFEIDFMYAAISEGADSGIRAAVYDANSNLVAGTITNGSITSTEGESPTQSLPSAAPADPTSTGTALSKKFMLVLSGVPSSITEGNTLQYTNVGSITVEVVKQTS